MTHPISLAIFFQQLYRTLYPGASIPENLLGQTTNNTFAVGSSPTLVIRHMANFLSRSTDSDDRIEARTNEKSPIALQFEEVLGAENVMFLDQVFAQQGFGKVDPDFAFRKGFKS